MNKQLTSARARTYMLSKRCVRATREETAIFIARATIGQACLGTPFSDDELREAVRHVEVTYGAFDERPEQFHAVAAAAALQAAKFADRYGSFGYETEREIAGRSSLRYWLDHAFGEHNVGAHWVTKDGQAAARALRARRCSRAQVVGALLQRAWVEAQVWRGREPRLALSLWEPGPMDSCAVARERLVTCCLDAACVADFELKYGVSIADAVPAEHLGVDALVAVETRQDELVAAKAEGAPPAPAKSEVCFPKDRKREITHYECGKNPWGELEIDLERFRAEGRQRLARTRAAGRQRSTSQRPPAPKPYPLVAAGQPGSRNESGSRRERQPLTGKVKESAGRRSAQAAPRRSRAPGTARRRRSTPRRASSAPKPYPLLATARLSAATIRFAAGTATFNRESRRISREEVGTSCFSPLASARAAGTQRSTSHRSPAPCLPTAWPFPPFSRNEPDSRPELQPLTGKVEESAGRRSVQAAPRRSRAPAQRGGGGRRRSALQRPLPTHCLAASRPAAATNQIRGRNCNL